MTLLKPAVAWLGAGAITVAFCLLIPMLSTNHRPPPVIQADPVPVAALPPEAERRLETGPSGGGSPSSVRAPAVPATPLSLPNVPSSADVAVPAMPSLSGLSLAAPTAPENGLAGPGGPGFDKPPQVLTRLDPYYPLQARKSGTQGHVLVRALVDEHGRVAEADVVESEPAGVFDAAALKAVRGWRFAPAQRMGNPVAVRIDIPIRFRLDQ